MTPLTIEINSTSGFSRNMAQEQVWKLESDTPNKSGIITVVPRPVLREDEKQIDFPELLVRQQALAQHVFGQRYAEAIIASPEKIPKDWIGINIIFPGTVWGDGPPWRPVTWVPLIHLLYGDYWEFCFRWPIIGLGFTKDDYVLVPVSP